MNFTGDIKGIKMIERKYKAWDKRYKIMREVISLNFHTCRMAYWGEHEEYLHIDFSDIDLLLYTGVNDKNDKEIYDGDILKCEAQNYIGKVWFANGSFMTDCEGFGDHPISGTNSDDFEKIGNIHENPELLEV